VTTIKDFGYDSWMSEAGAGRVVAALLVVCSAFATGACARPKTPSTQRALGEEIRLGKDTPKVGRVSLVRKQGTIDVAGKVKRPGQPTSPLNIHTSNAEVRRQELLEVADSTWIAMKVTYVSQTKTARDQWGQNKETVGAVNGRTYLITRKPKLVFTDEQGGSVGADELEALHESFPTTNSKGIKKQLGAAAPAIGASAVEDPLTRPIRVGQSVDHLLPWLLGTVPDSIEAMNEHAVFDAIHDDPGGRVAMFAIDLDYIALEEGLHMEGHMAISIGARIVDGVQTITALKSKCKMRTADPSPNVPYLEGDAAFTGLEETTFH